jgi:UDP-N-acetylmuramate--alanine ligase
MSKKVHFIGIKGVGMSALAIVAQGMGYTVTGSDVPEEFITDSSLRAAAIEPLSGFDPSHIISDIDTVVVGTAFGINNSEVKAAREKSLPIVTYSEFLGQLSKEKKTIAIAGTHGKTTTTSLLAYLLYKSGVDPSWVIGTGHVSGLPSHGYSGQGSYFVTEADDYKRANDDPTPKFLDLSPSIAVITSIEHDHPDMYPQLEDCVNAFRQFISRVVPNGLIIANGDDQNVRQLMNEMPDRQFLTYGFHDSNDYQISPLERKDNQNTWFNIVGNEGKFGPFILPLPGWHNLMNAAAAIIAAMKANITLQSIQQILPTFENVERRFQVLGSVGEQVIVDDYAHHPTAVRATLAAAKEQYPDKPIWCLFQSHTFSRTMALLTEFGQAFSDADHVIVTDIFGSARESEISITGEDLKQEIAKHHQNVMFVPKEKLEEYIENNLPKSSVLITMGAGDIYKIGRSYIERHPS